MFTPSTLLGHLPNAQTFCLPDSVYTNISSLGIVGKETYVISKANEDRSYLYHDRITAF